MQSELPSPIEKSFPLFDTWGKMWSTHSQSLSKLDVRKAMVEQYGEEAVAAFEARVAQFNREERAAKDLMTGPRATRPRHNTIGKRLKQKHSVPLHPHTGFRWAP